MWVLLFLCCLVGYALTAHWFGINNADSIAAAWPARQFALEGSFFLENVANLPVNPWFISSAEQVASNRMPGVVLVGVPLQVALLPFDVAVMTPAVLTAVLVTAAAVANLSLVMYRLEANPRLAAGCAIGLAFGTGLWCNASAELWTHGPDAFWLSLALLALQSHRHWLAGLAMAPAIMTRPHLAIAAAAIGLTVSCSSRTFRPLYRIGLPASAGLGLLLLWHRHLLGTPSVGGGYSYAGPRITDTTPTAWVAMFESAAGSLVSPLRGLVVFTPFVLLAAVALWKGLGGSPPWVRGAAIGGLAYQIVQWRVNSFEGGTGYYSYRLPIELLLLCAPLAFLGYARLSSRFGRVSTLARLLVGVSIATHVVGVFWYQPLGGLSQERDPWRTWGLYDAAISRGASGTVVAIIAFVAVMALCLVRLPRTEGSDPLEPAIAAKALQTA